jgi:hypothetical protein
MMHLDCVLFHTWPPTIQSFALINDFEDDSYDFCDSYNGFMCKTSNVSLVFYGKSV